MKKMYQRQKSVAASTFILLAVAAFATPSTAAIVEGVEPSTPGTTSKQNEGVYQLALARDACRRISRSGGVNVRQQPSINSPIVGRVANGRNVAIRNLGDTGWVAIFSPLHGYVAANYLTYCASSLSPRNVCRQVTASGGLNVRQQPSINSPIVGRVANGRNVAIRNLGDTGWTRIFAPLKGYVDVSYLTSCS